MDERAMGPLAALLWIIGAILAVVLLLAGVLYVSDYGLEATVIDKECSTTGLVGGGSATSQVTVRTRAFGIEHTVQEFPNQQCQVLRAGDDGNFVVYHVRSGHTILYEREGGSCVWDSERGVPC